MSKRVADWLEGVVMSYGSLDAFNDARSVRIMLGFAKAEIVEHESIAAEVTDASARALTIFADDIAAAKVQVQQLEEWLLKRGYTP